MKKTIIITLLLLLISASSIAQNARVYFAYDANGNRIVRSLTVRNMEENSKSIDTLKSFEQWNKTKDCFGQASLTLYPNPTQSTLTIELQGMGTHMVTAKIVSAIGIVVKQTVFIEGTHVFDLSGLPSGIYLLQLSTPNESQTWKIIKK